MKSLKTYITWLLLPILITISTSITSSQNNFWSQVNGLDGGRISKLITSPNGTIFASESKNGLYASSNGGENWSLVINSYGGSSLIQYKQEMYWASNEKMYISIDSGKSWTRMADAPMLYYKLSLLEYKIHPLQTTAELLAATTEGVYRTSTFGYWPIVGKSWVTTFGIDTLKALLIATYDPNYDDGIIWRVYPQDALHDEAYAVGIADIPHMINGFFTTPHGSIFVYTVAGLYRSTDNGKSWQTKIVSTSLGVNALEYDINGYLLAATESGVYRSTNNGDSWVSISNGLRNIDNICRDSSGQILFSGNGGIYKSSDNGANWQRSTKGIIATCIWDFAFDTNGTIFAATDIGLCRSTDNGISWSIMSDSSGLSFFLLSNMRNGKIWANGNYLCRSTDYGNSWNIIWIPWELTNGKSTNCITLTANGDIWVAVNGMLRSTDNGISWAKSDSGITVGYWGIDQIVSSPNGTLFACEKTDGVIHRSLDGGDHWTSILKLPSYNSAGEIAINQNGDIFVTSDHYSNLMYRSTDNGTNWTQLTHGQSVSSIIINSSNDIYIQSYGILKRSTDNGDNWTDIANSVLPDGVQQSVVGSIGVIGISSSGHIFVGTYNSGIYKSIQSTTTDVKNTNESPTTFRLASNYPNPFNPSTTIRFSLPVKELVTLKIFNLLGQEVATLVDEEKMPGNYTVPWNAGSASTGIYICQLKAGKYRMQQKMLLIK